jgi:Ca2+-binding RTX toxin-like protein
MPRARRRREWNVNEAAKLAVKPGLACFNASIGLDYSKGDRGMPTITMTLPTDMETYDLFGIRDSDITQESATQITAFNSDDDETYIFTGSFGGFTSDGLPTTGTATGFVLQVDGSTDITISHASLPVPDFFNFLVANDIIGLNTEVLAGNDSIEGSSRGDSLYGYGGDDTIVESGGTNYLRGMDGNDSIQGGSGFDDINGNKGDDTIDGGSGGSDWLVGGQANDLITAHASQNILYGNLGDDTLHGGTGGDLMRGGQGDDVIVGGSGNDWISGDRGSDTVTGGAGADTFHTFSGAGMDVVTDFNVTEGDKVQVDAGTTYTLSQSGSDTLIDMGNGDQMILRNVTLSTLPSGWIFTL